MGKKIVLDLVFHAQSLNYDQGFGNYSELKKVPMWDGTEHVLVSRYAIRYSILEMLKDKWKLAGKEELKVDNKNKVVQMSEKVISERKIHEFPEFWMFGFLVAQDKGDKKKGLQIKKTSPVKISHAISMNPFRNSALFYANLGMMNRAGKTGSNPTNVEEHLDFYIYNITIDVDEVGKIELSKEDAEKIGINKKEDLKYGIETIEISEEEDKYIIKIKKDEVIEKIKDLLKAVFNLKRTIRGRYEDLSPWLAIIGLYNNNEIPDTFKDRISLVKKKRYSVKREEEKTNEGNKSISNISEEIYEELAPAFEIKGNAEKGVFVYCRSELKDSLTTDFEKEINKEKAIEKIEKFLKGENNYAR